MKWKVFSMMLATMLGVGIIPAFVSAATFYIPSNYTSVEACFDAINQSDDTCVLVKSDYEEVFSGSRSYNFSDTDASSDVLQVHSVGNVSIDFNDSVMVGRYGVSTEFISLYNTSNVTFRNFNVTPDNGYVFKVSSGGDNDDIVIDDVNNFGTTYYFFRGEVGSVDRLTLSNSTVTGDTGSIFFKTFKRGVLENLRIVSGSVRIRSNFNITLNNITFLDDEDYLTLDGNIREGLVINNSVIPRIKDDGWTIKGSYFVNNIFSYSDEDNLNFVSGSANNTIKNNTFTKCGNITYSDHYLSSFSPFNFSGNAYDEMYRFYNAAMDDFASVSSDDDEVTSVVTGSNSFNLWLCSGGGAYYTLYVENTTSSTCDTVCPAQGLSCDYSEDNAFTKNGLGNDYTWEGDANVTDGYTNPPYIHYNNQTHYNAMPIRDSGKNNNISANTFLNSNIPILTNGTNIKIWDNMFLNHSPDNIKGADYCVGGEGNFYGEILTPQVEDCGPISTAAAGDQHISWDGQSSKFQIYYDIFLNGTYQMTTSYEGMYTEETGNQTIRIVPHSEINGTRYNATNYNSTLHLGVGGELIGSIIAPFAFAIGIIGWFAFKLDDEHRSLKYFYMLASQLFLFTGSVLLSQVFTTKGMTTAADAASAGVWLFGFIIFITLTYTVLYLLIKGGFSWLQRKGDFG